MTTASEQLAAKNKVAEDAMAEYEAAVALSREEDLIRKDKHARCIACDIPTLLWRC